MENVNKPRKKIMTNIIKLVFVILLIYIQAKFFEIEIEGSSDFLRIFNCIIEVLRVVIVFHIIYRCKSPSYKLVWTIFIIFFPIQGMALYIIVGNPVMPKYFRNKIEMEYEDSKNYLKYDSRIYDEIKEIDKLRYNQINYLYNVNSLPIYKNTYLEYLEIGEKYFESLLEDISKAKKYIFMEYFSITDGEMWDRLIATLKQKSAEGIKIYVITDGIGSCQKHPKNFEKRLKEAKIDYVIFNSSFIFINRYLNFRDHRKITVIDGKIAYTGGINIGDEYINKDDRYGNWKDVGIKIIGKPVKSYILMFIRMWNLCKESEKLDYQYFINSENIEISNEDKDKGYIMPYCDGPENISNPAQNLYLEIINTAKNYVYITTPYLVLDNEVMIALINRAKSGVDVRIITPYIPDKIFVNFVTKSFYKVLLEAGVKIYEYKPGFIHSKLFVTDDELATVGTINLDFRGLYLHYECGNLIYKTGKELVIKEDFLNTLEKSIEIKLDEWEKRSLIVKIADKLLMTFSPLV